MSGNGVTIDIEKHPGGGSDVLYERDIGNYYEDKDSSKGYSL